MLLTCGPRLRRAAEQVLGLALMDGDALPAEDTTMAEEEEPVAVLRAVIDAMNNGQDHAGLANMAGDVVIIDDVPPFRRSGRHEAELWFQRLAVARHQVDASLTLKDADVRVADDKAYVVAPGLYRGMLEGSGVDVQGTLIATLRRHQSSWLVDGLIWGCEI